MLLAAWAPPLARHQRHRSRGGHRPTQVAITRQANAGSARRPRISPQNLIAPKRRLYRCQSIRPSPISTYPAPGRTVPHSAGAIFPQSSPRLCFTFAGSTATAITQLHGLIGALLHPLAHRQSVRRPPGVLQPRRGTARRGIEHFPATIESNHQSKRSRSRRHQGSMGRILWGIPRPDSLPVSRPTASPRSRASECLMIR